VALLGAALAWPAFGGPRHFMVDLGTLGGEYSFAYAINDAGQVCGHSYTATGDTHAFLWDHAGGTRDLGTLGGGFSYAWAINAAGQVCGSAQTASGEEHAFIWDVTNGMQDLGTLGGDWSSVQAMNGAGQVCGSAKTASGQQHAFVWDPANGMQDLGTLGGSYSRAVGINASGQVVGEVTGSDGCGRAYIWDASNGMQVLGNPLGGRSEARAINDAGQVCGTAYNGDYHQAFTWHPVGGAQLLMRSQDEEIAANGINASGQVCGIGRGPWNSPFAYFWDPVTGFREVGSYCTDTFALAINDAGLICGSRPVPSYPYPTHAFAWDPLGGLEDLGTLGGSESGAYAVNSAGQICGYADTAGGLRHAFVALLVVPVTIDIKPGTYPNAVNLGANGTVPVAILSTSAFDATTVDPVTVTLASATVKLKGNGTPMYAVADVNGDGLLDILVHIATQALQLSPNDTQAELRAMTRDGTPIAGVDTVRVVP